MDLRSAAQLGSLVSKDYAEGLFELLVSYQDIPATEAVSRLNLHIRTSQDVLEAPASLGILTKEEAHEKKRAYFRYSLVQHRITMDVDLTQIKRRQAAGELSAKIRERKNPGASFSTARNNRCISQVAIWTGEGRERRERKLSLTMAQGKFLYHLPLPDAEHLSISEIMKEADVNAAPSPEILDLAELLARDGVIEVQ